MSYITHRHSLARYVEVMIPCLFVCHNNLDIGVKVLTLPYLAADYMGHVLYRHFIHYSFPVFAP